MRCASCFSPDHVAADCKALAPHVMVRRVKCPSCWSTLTPAELEEHKEFGCVNVRRPQRIAEVSGGSHS